MGWGVGEGVGEGVGVAAAMIVGGRVSEARHFPA